MQGQLLVIVDSGVEALRARATLQQLAYQIAASSMMKRKPAGGSLSGHGPQGGRGGEGSLHPAWFAVECRRVWGCRMGQRGP